MKKYLPFLLCLSLVLNFSFSYAQENIFPEGIIAARNGKIVTVKWDSIPQFPNDSAFTMSKHFETKLGKMNMTGWLNIANVSLVTTAGQTSTVKILEEKSEILVNDEKVDHFKIGNRVKLEPLKKEEE